MSGVLEGRVAFVTGAARGIGQATAALLAEHGARVVCADVDGDALKDTVEPLGERGTAVAADLTDPVVPGEIVALGKEWGPLRINVNAVAFGFVETRLTAETSEAGTFQRGGQRIALGIPANVRELATSRIPLGRGATAAEAAGGIFLLCTPWSNFVHGQVLTVAGGQADGMSF